MPKEKSWESVSRYIFSYREKESPAASSFKFRYILRFPLELLLRKTSKRRRTDALSLNECPLITANFFRFFKCQHSIFRIFSAESSMCKYLHYYPFFPVFLNFRYLIFHEYISSLPLVWQIVVWFSTTNQTKHTTPDFAVVAAARILCTHGF